MAKLLKTILDIQATNPQLALCGSAALIYAGLLPKRDIGDLDFVLNKRHVDALQGIYNLRADVYPKQKDDRYKSYHGNWSFSGLFSGYKINLLVFNDDILLTSEAVIFEGEHIRVQTLDNVLKWKEKYNRPKDIKDLNDITTKAVQDILLS